MDHDIELMQDVYMTPAQRKAYESIRADAETWRSMKGEVAPLCSAIVGARTGAEEDAACKALAKWMNDDLDAALHTASAG